MQRPALVATDLDGTVVRRDQGISERVRRALALVEQSGARLVLVTGRPPRWMSGIADGTGHRGVAICANGALVYDLHTEQVLESHLIEPADAVAIVAALRDAVPGLTFAVEHPTGFGREEAYPTRYAQPDALIATVEELCADPLAKLLVRHTGMDADALLAVTGEVLGDTATLTHASRIGLVEISAAGVSKASGLARYAASHGVAAADVLAFGDMPNDLPMLAWAGRSVAVANAHPQVLAAVDEVTASVDDDGVALVLERVFAGPAPPPPAVEGQRSPRGGGRGYR